MFSLSNGLSLLRAPLAFVFLIENTALRIAAIILAMVTDSIDGYVARRSRSVTRLGTILDPAMDKFFVFFALGVFLVEGRLWPWEACAMISRDFFLCVFAIYLSVSGLWETYELKSIRWGKAATALQFIVLIGLTLNITFPGFFYAVFILLGSLLFLELFKIKKQRSSIND